MSYTFKMLPESVRAVLIAVAIVVLQLIVSTDLAKIESWRVWLTGVAVAAAHALAVGILSALTPSEGTQNVTPAPSVPSVPGSVVSIHVDDKPALTIPAADPTPPSTPPTAPAS